MRNTDYWGHTAVYGYGQCRCVGRPEALLIRRRRKPATCSRQSRRIIFRKVRNGAIPYMTTPIWKSISLTGGHRIEKNAALYDVIRIDHFLGVVRYYTIPFQEKDCCNGKWNKGPGKKLTDVMEESAGDCRTQQTMPEVPSPEAESFLQELDGLEVKSLMFAFDGNTGNENLPHNLLKKIT